MSIVVAVDHRVGDRAFGDDAAAPDWFGKSARSADFSTE
jgi:hypothetical protein